MEARQGRNPAGGSMRSTTARPAISQVAGDAQCYERAMPPLCHHSVKHLKLSASHSLAVNWSSFQCKSG